MNRYITKYIQEDLDKKLILLTGPRQAGKTTLSKMLNKNFDYFNYDNVDDSKDDIPSVLVEVKWNGNTLSPNFEIFKKFFPETKMIQISKKLEREKTFPNGAEIRLASKWLSELNLP